MVWSGDEIDTSVVDREHWPRGRGMVWYADHQNLNIFLTQVVCNVYIVGIGFGNPILDGLDWCAVTHTHSPC